MIEIKREILDQIHRSSMEDSRYLAKIMGRIDPEIKTIIQTLVNADISLANAAIIFCSYFENGLDNFVAQEIDCDAYFEEIEKFSPEIADYITICDFSQANRVTTLVVLYRIFESELEIRKI